MDIKRILWAFWLLLISFSSQALADHEAYECRILGNSTPPLSIIENGKITGFSIDLLRKIYAAAELDLDACEIRPVPFVRGLRELETHENNVMFSVARTFEREHKFKWVGPIYQLNMSLIGKKRQNISIQTYEELHEFKIGTLKSSAPEQILINNGLSVDMLKRASRPVDNIRKLEGGRLDLVAHAFAPFAYEMRMLGIDSDDYEEVFVLASARLYFAFNKQTPDHVISKLQKALDDLKTTRKQSGKTAYEDLLDQYALY